MAVVLGRRGEGKSTLVKSWLRAWRRVLIIDPKREYPGKAHTSLATLHAAIRDGERFVLSYQPAGLVDREHLEAVDIAAQMALTYGDMLMVIEEAGRYTQSGKSICPQVRLLISEGRHHEVAVAAVSQRAASIGKDIIESADTLYLFHTHGEGSISYLASTIGADAAAELGALTPGHYLTWDARRGIGRGTVALPGRRLAAVAR